MIQIIEPILKINSYISMYTYIYKASLWCLYGVLASFQDNPYWSLPRSMALDYLCVILFHTVAGLVGMTNRICRWYVISQGRHIKSLVASALLSLASFILGEVSYHALRALRQVCGEAYIERNWIFLPTTSEEPRSPANSRRNDPSWSRLSNHSQASDDNNPSWRLYCKLIRDAASEQQR